MPIARIATASNVLVVNNALPARNIAELVRLAKDKPGALNYASAGVGTPAHLAGEMLNLLADIKVAHVPYKGAAPALLDVIAGNAQYMITSPIAAARAHSRRTRARAGDDGQRAQSEPSRPADDRRYGARLRDHADMGHRRAGRHTARRGPPVGRRDRQGDEHARREGARRRHRRNACADRGEAFAEYMAKERERLGQVIAKSGIVLSE